MKTHVLILSLWLAFLPSIVLAQTEFGKEPYRILEKYECLSVTIHDTGDDSYLDDSQNHAIVTHTQINGSKKSAELITVAIGTDFTYLAEVLSKESYDYGEYEYVRYHGRNFEKGSGSEDVIMAMVYEKNGSKVVPFSIVFKFDFSSIELLLSKIVRDI